MELFRDHFFKQVLQRHGFETKKVGSILDSGGFSTSWNVDFTNLNPFDLKPSKYEPVEGLEFIKDKSANKKLAKNLDTFWSSQWKSVSDGLKKVSTQGGIFASLLFYGAREQSNLDDNF